MALVGKNLHSCPDVGKHSSSYLLGNSVVVTRNPLLEDCVVNGCIRSDLEFALQSKDKQAIDALNASVRNPVYGNQSPRHLSAADCLNAIDACDNQIKDLKASVQEMQKQQSSQSTQSAPTGNTDSSQS